MEVYDHAVFVLHGDGRATAHDCCTNSGGKVVACKLIEVLQIIDFATAFDVGAPDVAKAQSINRERIYLALKVQGATAPGVTDTNTDGATAQHECGRRIMFLST